MGIEDLAPDTCPRRAYEFGPWDHAASGKDKPERRGNEDFDRCPFCGTIMPEDVIRLIESGRAVVHLTDKRYKVYLHFTDGTKTEGGAPKVYMQHFSREQVERANAAVQSQKT